MSVNVVISFSLNALGSGPIHVITTGILSISLVDAHHTKDRIRKKNGYIRAISEVDTKSHVQ